MFLQYMFLLRLVQVESGGRPETSPATLACLYTSIPLPCIYGARRKAWWEGFCSSKMCIRRTEEILVSSVVTTSPAAPS